MAGLNYKVRERRRAADDWPDLLRGSNQESGKARASRITQSFKQDKLVLRISVVRREDFRYGARLETGCAERKIYRGDFLRDEFEDALRLFFGSLCILRQLGGLLGDFSRKLFGRKKRVIKLM
jgi:hypothetical protein